MSALNDQLNAAVSEAGLTGLELEIRQQPSLALLDPAKKKELYDFLEREIAEFVPDLETETGRKKIASLAYKVARTKTAIDDAGALLKSEWLKKSQAIDLSRRDIREDGQLKTLDQTIVVMAVHCGIEIGGQLRGLDSAQDGNANVLRVDRAEILTACPNSAKCSRSNG